MSARQEVLTVLAGLDRKKYTVSEKPPGSDTRILKGRGYITAQRAGLTPASDTGAWGHAVPVYLVVGGEAYTTTEDLLEVLLPAVVAQLESAQNIAVTDIDRDVFFDTGDADGFHGYRITTVLISSSI